MPSQSTPSTRNGSPPVCWSASLTAALLLASFRARRPPQKPLQSQSGGRQPAAQIFLAAGLGRGSTETAPRAEPRAFCAPSSPDVTCPSPSIKRCPASAARRAALPLPEWSWAPAPPWEPPPPLLRGWAFFFFFFRRRGGTGEQPPLRVALGSLQSSVCLPSSPFAPAQLWVSPPTPVHPSLVSAPSASRDQPSPLPLHFWLGLSSLFLYLPKLISAAVSPGLGLPPSCPRHPGGLPPSPLSPCLGSVPGPAGPPSSLRFFVPLFS